MTSLSRSCVRSLAPEHSISRGPLLRLGRAARAGCRLQAAGCGMQCHRRLAAPCSRRPNRRVAATTGSVAAGRRLALFAVRNTIHAAADPQYARPKVRLGPGRVRWRHVRWRRVHLSVSSPRESHRINFGPKCSFAASDSRAVPVPAPHPTHRRAQSLSGRKTRYAEM